MKKIALLCSFLLITSLACFVTDVAPPAPSLVPTYDSNLIATMVVQTAEILALSATVTNTIPADTPVIPFLETPTSTLTLAATVTNTLTAIATVADTLTATATPSLTNAIPWTPSAAVTVIYVPITLTSPPVANTPVPATATKIPATNTLLSATTTKIPNITLTFTPPIPSASPTLKPPTTTATAAVCPQTNNAFEMRVIELINEERAKMGLSAVNYQPQLTLTAQLHSADMACNNYFSHTGRDGSSFSERAARQGYAIGYGAENIAAGYSSPQDVVRGWMNSPGHKANILGENYVDVGVGYAYGSSSAYGAYWTAVFGSP